MDLVIKIIKIMYDFVNAKIQKKMISLLFDFFPFHSLP